MAAVVLKQLLSPNFLSVLYKHYHKPLQCHEFFIALFQQKHYNIPAGSTQAAPEVLQLPAAATLCTQTTTQLDVR